MLSHHCPECTVGWMPYMTVKGACPQCGSGTVRRHEPPDHDAVARFDLVREARRRRATYEAFEVFCAARDSAAQPTEPIDVAAVHRALEAAGRECRASA